jgi:hypothetical protein
MNCTNPVQADPAVTVWSNVNEVVFVEVAVAGYAAVDPVEMFAYQFPAVFADPERVNVLFPLSVRVNAVIEGLTVAKFVDVAVVVAIP